MSAAVAVAAVASALIWIAAVAIGFSAARWARRRRPATHKTLTWTEASGHVICTYCGGVHSYLCPRLKSVMYDPNVPPDAIPRILSVEFWPEYAAELWVDVVWPEEPA